jgi:hypothetical protein
MNNNPQTIGKLCRVCSSKFRSKRLYEEHAYRMEEADELNEILSKELHNN